MMLWAGLITRNQRPYQRGGVILGSRHPCDGCPAGVDGDT